MQRYRLDGTHVADDLIGDPMIGGGAVSRDGEVVVPTLGDDSALLIEVYRRTLERLAAGQAQ